MPIEKQVSAKWIVPSSSGAESYVVTMSCSCPDHQHRLRPCKHIRAVVEAEDNGSVALRVVDTSKETIGVEL